MSALVGDEEAVYPIGIAARLLAVHPRTLRLYEAAGLIFPARRGRRRYYSNNDLKWIRCLREIIHQQKISIPALRMLLASYPCYEIKGCPPEVRNSCSAYLNRGVPCFEIVRSFCAKRFELCTQCRVYQEYQRSVFERGRRNLYRRRRGSLRDQEDGGSK